MSIKLAIYMFKTTQPSKNKETFIYQSEKLLFCIYYTKTATFTKQNLDVSW